MTDERNDSMGSVLLDAGRSRALAAQFINPMALMGARAAYANGGLVARIVDMPADLATARGVTIENGGDGIEGEMERLRVLDHLSDAIRWARLVGGGAIVAMTEDGGTLPEPLDPGRLRQIQEFRVVSVDDMQAGPTRYDDPNLPNYGWPVLYNVKFPGARQHVYVHESRIIEVPGEQTASSNTDTRDIPWAGRGIGSSTLRAIERYRDGVKWAEKLLERSQQAVHKMKGLAEMLMAKQESVVRARIDLVDQNRTAINGVAVDAEDDYTITSATLAGVKDTLGEMQVAVAAESGWPVTVLFGRSPGGLNATGDSDWAIVYQSVGQIQRKVKPALERLLSLIYAQNAVQIEKPDNWKAVWNPLEVLNDTQRAEVENKKADTRVKVATALKMLVVDAQAMSQDEATKYLQDERMFGMEPADADGTGGAAQYAKQT
jgi:phage-related protein (TIGR01555 family)